MAKFQDPFDNPEFVASFLAETNLQVKPKVKDDKGFGTDMVASFGTGANQMVKGVGTFFGGSNSTLAEIGESGEAYWEAEKSEKLKAKEAEFGAAMQDENVGVGGILAKVVTDPYLAASMLSSSAPSTAVGMGVGGVVAKGMKAAGLMVDAAGGLTKVGARVAGGVGEGLVLVPDVYQNTQGDGASSVAALALGVLSSVAAPGNVGASVARRVTGTSASAIETALNKTVARRVGAAGVGEAAQEFVQEGGQALLEQYGRNEDFDFNAAAKQGAVGSALGGVMGVGLHPITGEGAPTPATQAPPVVEPTPEVLAAREQVAIREQALAQDPNNRVLREELNNAIAVEQHLTAPTERTELQMAATLANLESARDPDNEEKANQAQMATAALSLNVLGAEGTREAARVAANVGTDAILAAPDVNSSLSAFGDEQRAVGTLSTTAQSIQNTVQGVEVSATYEEEGDFAAEVITPEQEQKAELHALRARQLELKNQLQEQRLVAEVAKARAQSEAAAPVATQPTEKAKEEITLEPVAESVQADQAFIDYNNLISDWQSVADDQNEPAEVRAAATRRVEQLRAQQADLGVADTVADQDFIDYNNLISDQEAIAADRLRPLTERNAAQARAQELRAEQQQFWPEAFAGTELAAPPDEIQVEEREMTATEADAVAQTPEEVRYREASDRLLAAGYSANAAKRIRTIAEGASNAELREAMNDLRTSPERRGIAHAILRTRGVQAMTGAQFDTREDALERGLTEALENSGVSRSTVLGSLASRDEAYVRDIAAARDRVAPRNQYGLARATLAFRQGRHMGEIDDTPMQRAPLQTEARAPVADVARQAAAEVAAEAARPQTGAGRQITMSFERRAEAALRDGTLTKLGSFWKRLMSKPNQRSLPAIDTSDLNDRARRAVASGAAIPQDILNEVADRYNAALKENARDWAEANNQVFNEAEWDDPITNVSQNGVGANAGFAIYIKGLGRRGRNPFMPVPNQRPAYFYADTGIHASSLEDAPGSADLAYRFAAQIADIRGKGWKSDTVLSTVNNLRRQLQSLAADTLFGAGVIHPLTSEGDMGPQGVPSSIWNRATAVQRIGLNALRASHSVSEVRGRADHIPTGGRFTENLVFDPQGRIKAVSDPLTPNGFANGTIVTDDMLEAKIGTVDPVTGFMPRARESGGRGGVGADTARLAILNNTILAAIENNPEARVPSWISRMAQEQGSRMGGWFFSEAESSSAVTGPISQETASARVEALLGKDLAKLLIDSKLVGFVNDESALSGETFFEAEGRVQGATTPDGRILLVLGNLTEDTFDGVLLHEGAHATMRALLGEETYSQLMGKLETLLAAGKGADWLQNAEARIPDNTAAASRTEELAAYALEQAANGAPESNPLIRWAKDLLSRLRSAIIQSKHVPESLRLWAMNHIQPQDLVKLAIAGLRARAVTAQEGTSLSTGLRSSAEYQAEIDELMAEHSAEETTGPRRAEINAKVARLRTAWRMAEEAEYAQLRLSVAPVAEEAVPGKSINVLNNSRRRPLERLGEKFIEIFQQKHVRLKRILQEAKVTMEDIQLDTIGALDRLGSKLETKQKDLVMKPMAQIENVLVQAGFENGGVAREQMDEFLKNRHVAEYNRHTAEINPARYAMVDGKRTYKGGFDEANPGSGIFTKDAEAAIADVLERASNGDKQAQAILEGEKIYRQMIEDLQDYAVAQGLEKQEVIDVWRKKFKNYVPFNRNLDLQEDLSIGSVPGTQGFSLRAGISRRAMGSKAEIISPLASTILLGLKTTTRGENAYVARTILNFARKFTPNFSDKAGNLVPMWSVETIPNQRVLKKMNVYQVRLADGTMSAEFYNRQKAGEFADNEQAAWKAAHPNEPVGASGIELHRVGDGPQNRVVVMPIPNILNRKNVLVIPENGENKIMVFREDSEDAMAILHALKSGGGSSDINKYLLGPRMFSRWVVATSTGYNPVFMFFNAARDVQGAMLSINGDKVPGWTVKDSLAIAKNFPSAVKEIWKQGRKEFRALHSNTGPAAEPARGSIAWFAKKMAEHGGATGVAQSIYDVEGADTQLRRLYGQEKLETFTGVEPAKDWLSKFNTGIINLGDKFARFAEGETDTPLMGWVSKHLVSEVSRMNMATELATRTLAFKASFEKFEAAGKSEAEAFTLAANISKNISTNFNRRGTASGLINQLYPFFNAALQGSARLAEVMFEKETYTIDKAGHPMLDQRTKLTSFGKTVLYSLPALGAVQAALLAMAGYDDEEVPPQIKDRAFVFPLWEGKYVAIPMPHGFNTIINFGRELTDATFVDREAAASHIGRATLGQISSFNPFGNAGNWVTDMLPAIFDAPVSLYMNKDAFGRPIAKESPDRANPTPGYTRAKEGASATGRNFAEFANWISGGNADQSGVFSPTPDQVDYGLAQLTGGVGREVAKIGALAVAGLKDLADVPREEIPLYKIPLAGRLIGSVSEPAAMHGKLTEVRTRINDKYARYKGLTERGETEKADAFWDANPELELRKEVEKFVRKDTKQRKARAMARTGGEVEAVNQISAEQNEKLEALLAEIEAVKQGRR